MSRYSPITPDMQRALDVLTQARASALHHVSQGDVLRALHGTAPPDAVCDALEALQTASLITSCRITLAGTTQSVYWPTGLKPIIPHTDEEIAIMAESKTTRLLRLIAEHGPIDSIALTAKANAEGANIPAKNLSGLLAASITSGKVVTSRPGKYTIYQMAPPVAPASPPASPPAAGLDASKGDESLLAQANRELVDQVQRAENALATARADLDNIYAELDVADAREAIAGIEHLIKLSTARTDQDFGDLGRYRELLDQIASSLHCDSLDLLPEVAASLGAAVPAPTGRLAILTTHDMVGAVLEYLEPHVSEEYAQKLLLAKISRGQEQCILVRALYQARHHITYGPIEAPAVATLRG